MGRKYEFADRYNLYNTIYSDKLFNAMLEQKLKNCDDDTIYNEVLDAFINAEKYGLNNYEAYILLPETLGGLSHIDVVESGEDIGIYAVDRGLCVGDEFVYGSGCIRPLSKKPENYSEIFPYICLSREVDIEEQSLVKFNKNMRSKTEY